MPRDVTWPEGQQSPSRSIVSPELHSRDGTEGDGNGGGGMSPGVPGVSTGWVILQVPSASGFWPVGQQVPRDVTWPEGQQLPSGNLVLPAPQSRGMEHKEPMASWSGFECPRSRTRCPTSNNRRGKRARPRSTVVGASRNRRNNRGGMRLAVLARSEGLGCRMHRCSKIHSRRPLQSDIGRVGSKNSRKLPLFRTHRFLREGSRRRLLDW